MGEEAEAATPARGIAPPGVVTEPESSSREPDPLGLRETGELLRTAARLLGRHWLPLLAIAVGSLAAHALTAELAVVAGRVGAVPGFLALALVPLVGLVALVGMLLVLRSRDAERSDGWSVVAVVGSVLVPYLVVYESRGDLRADLIDYVRAGIWEDIPAGTEFDRLPQIGSWLVLGIVVGAFLLRALGSRLVHSSRWPTDDPRRGVLQVAVGYAEAVWVTLGAWVLTGVLADLGDWWSTRAVAQDLFAFWANVRENLPALGALGDWLVAALAVVADAAVTGLVVPLSLLTIAVIVYGLQVADTIAPDTVVDAVKSRRLTGLTRRIGDAPLAQAWGRLSNPEGRFGALLGGLALVLRSAFAPVLAYCVLFTLISQLDVVVWWLARAVLGFRTEDVWVAWYDPLNGISEALTLMLTVTLTAVFADRLLTRFGAAGQLRERGRRRRA